RRSIGACVLDQSVAVATIDIHGGEFVMIRHGKHMEPGGFGLVEIQREHDSRRPGAHDVTDEGGCAGHLVPHRRRNGMGSVRYLRNWPALDRIAVEGCRVLIVAVAEARSDFGPWYGTKHDDFAGHIRL